MVILSLKPFAMNVTCSSGSSDFYCSNLFWLSLFVAGLNDKLILCLLVLRSTHFVSLAL